MNFEPQLWEVNEAKWNCFVANHSAHCDQLLRDEVLHEAEAAHQVNKSMIRTVELPELLVVLLVKSLREKESE